MRPRKSVNVASIVGSPEEEEARPNLRLRIVGVVVLILFGVLVLRLWTLQVVEGKSYAAAVTRNQVRVVSVAAPRGEIVDRSGTVLVSNTPPSRRSCSSRRGDREPRHRRHGGGTGRSDAQEVQAPSTTSIQPYEPVPVAVGVRRTPCSSSRRTRPSIPASPWRRWPTDLSPGRYDGDPYLGLYRLHHGQLPGRHPNEGYTQGSQIGVLGIEAPYEPYLKGVEGRQALSVDASGQVVGTLSSTAPKIGDTVVLNIDTGLQQAVQIDLQRKAGKPPHPR